LIKNPHKKIEKAQNFKLKHIEKQKTTKSASLKTTEKQESKGNKKQNLRVNILSSNRER
jgi:hypothetical protein